MTTKKQYFYKVIRPGGYGIYSTFYEYDTSGAWDKVKGKLKWCENGFHVASLEQLPEWADESGYEVWLVECRGSTYKSKGSKHIFSEMRFVKCLGVVTETYPGTNFFETTPKEKYNELWGVFILSKLKAPPKKAKKG